MNSVHEEIGVREAGLPRTARPPTGGFAPPGDGPGQVLGRPPGGKVGLVRRIPNPKEADVNAVELLIQDHQMVRGLFQKFKSAQEAEDAEQMTDLATQIFEELEVHTTIEEEIFYPAVRDASDDIAETVDEGVQEHHVVDVLMDEMRGPRGRLPTSGPPR